MGGNVKRYREGIREKCKEIERKREKRRKETKNMPTF